MTEQRKNWTMEVGRSMGHVHENGNFTGLSLPLKTEAQREFAAYVLAALIAYQPPAGASGSATACNASIPDSNNRCTRDAGHPGEHRCLAIDVDNRNRKSA